MASPRVARDGTAGARAEAGRSRTIAVSQDVPTGLSGHQTELMVETSSGTAHVIAAGAGVPVVLLHGHGGLAQEIIAPLRPLAANYRLLAIDRPGYGWSSPHPADRMAPDRQAQWIDEILGSLGVSRAIVVGHSFGASIALWLAHARPERVSGLVLMAPFCRPVLPPRKLLLTVASRQITGWPLRWALPRVAPFVAGYRLTAAFDPNPIPTYMWDIPFHVAVQSAAVLAMAAELREFNDAMLRLWDRDPVVSVPTVMVTGDEDDLTTWEYHCDWLANRLRCRSVRLPGVGHMPHHVRPESAVEAVCWVDRTGRKRPGMALVRAALSKASSIRAGRRPSVVEAGSPSPVAPRDPPTR